ncbi:hypothetical protein ACWGCW_00680 [Streptomyces sp. NPDC054933]
MNTPMTDGRYTEIRTALANPTTTAAEFRTMAVELLAETDRLHGRADYWREGYRIATGQTDDELNAQTVIEEATARHPRPCRWPDSPHCDCEDDDQATVLDNAPRVGPATGEAPF